MRVLVTGAAGFVSSYMLEFLSKEKGVKLYGLDLFAAGAKNKKVIYFRCDITNFASVNKVIKKIRPDVIIHLAARTSPFESLRKPQEVFKINVNGEINILEAVRRLNIRPRVLIAGSCEEYGRVEKKDIPIKESQRLRPINAYAASKVTQDLLGLLYYKAYGFKIIRTRPFNHTGPGRPVNFASSNFARQIALIEKQRQRPVISVGNLNAVRDFSDVKDVIRAYWLLVKKGKPGEAYNVCSGKGCSIKQLLNMLLSLSKVRVEVKVEKNRIRPLDIPVFIGDCRKIYKDTGWQAQIPLKDTLRDLLNYWRDKV